VKFGSIASFAVTDMAETLPYATGQFDAVMSNVALHMFPDATTRAVFEEIRRVVRPSGLFLFHVNSVFDRPVRARRKPVVRELEANFVVEEDGQSMHFFSEAYLRDLLSGWSAIDLEPIDIANPVSGELFKHVWRGVARR